jgi:hypothetical protein
LPSLFQSVNLGVHDGNSCAEMAGTIVGLHLVKAVQIQLSDKGFHVVVPKIPRNNLCRECCGVFDDECETILRPVIKGLVLESMKISVL